MTLGKNVPEELDMEAIQEIESVHSALVRSAQAAIERDNENFNREKERQAEEVEKFTGRTPEEITESGMSK